MAEPTSYDLTAVSPDGFVDFYKLLQMPDDAPTSELQARMAALNSEALANSDHRNLNKRRDYQTLREYIPQARTALLDPDKRASYDAYAAQARSGAAPSSFSAFMGQLSGQVSDDERTDVLGVQDGRTGTRNTSSARPTATTRPTPSNTGDSGGVARRQPQVAKSGPPIGIIIGVVVVLIIIAVVVMTRR